MPFDSCPLGSATSAGYPRPSGAPSAERLLYEFAKRVDSQAVCMSERVNWRGPSRPALRVGVTSRSRV
jgi:hypothetical protein